MKDPSVIKVVLFEYVMACRLLHQQIAAVQFPHFAKKWLGSFSNDDGDDSENVSVTKVFAFFQESFSRLFQLA